MIQTLDSQKKEKCFFLDRAVSVYFRRLNFPSDQCGLFVFVMYRFKSELIFWYLPPPPLRKLGANVLKWLV